MTPERVADIALELYAQFLDKIAKDHPGKHWTLEDFAELTHIFSKCRKSLQ